MSSKILAEKGRSFSTWVCNNHLDEVVSQPRITYEGIADGGVPICSFCGDDMEFSSEEWEAPQQKKTFVGSFLVKDEHAGEFWQITRDFLVYAESMEEATSLTKDFAKAWFEGETCSEQEDGTFEFENRDASVQIVGLKAATEAGFIEVLLSNSSINRPVADEWPKHRDPVDNF